MTASKFIKFFILTGFTLALAACDLPSPSRSQEEDRDNGATFAVSSFEGKAISVNLHSEISIPISNTYNFSACVTNLLQKNKPLTGHKFIISELNEEVRSDMKGCVNWTESIQYNFLAPSKYLKFERTLSAVGTHRGSRIVSFAIDPWSHGEAKPREVVDLSKATVPEAWLIKDRVAVQEALKGQASDHSTYARSLWVDTGRLYAQEDRITSKGFEITYEIHGVPQILLSRINGERLSYDITEGKFSAEMQVIHVELKDGKIQRKVLAEQAFSEIKVSNKNLALRARLNFNAKYWGHIYIGLKLAARNAPSGLKSFEGLYYIGDFRQIKSNNWLKINSLVQNNSNFNLKDYVDGKYEQEDLPELLSDKKPETSLSARGEEQDIEGKNRIFVDELDFTFLKADGDVGHRRNIKYRVKACVSYPIDQGDIRGLKFNVTSFRRSETEPVKHPEGNPFTAQMRPSCFAWVEEMPVEMYGCQEYIKGFVQIENSDLGMNQRIHYYINPWLSTPQIALDEIYIRSTLGKECTKNQDAEKPRYIFINNFEYSLQAMKFDMDKNFNLLIHRLANIDIDTRVVNNADLAHGRGGSMPLRDGMFMVKLLVTNNMSYKDQPEYVTSAVRFARSRNGRIAIRNVDFTFKNPFDIGNRNSLYVQVLPVDENKLTTYKPKEGYTDYKLADGIKNFDEVIDNKTTLVPLIYEGKIVLMGNERGSFSLQDQHVDTILENTNLTDAQKVQEYFALLEQRKTLLTEKLTTGMKKIETEMAALSNASSLETYAKNYNLVLIDLDKDDKFNEFLQKLVTIDKSQVFKPMPMNQVAAGATAHQSRTQFHFNREILRAKKDVASEQKVQQELQGPLSVDMNQRLCLYWTNNMISDILKSEALVTMSRDCLNRNQAETAKMFLKETVYYVRDFKNFKHEIGIWEKMDIGTSFSMSNSHTATQSQTNTLSAGYGVSTKDLPGVGALFKFASASVGASHTISWGTQDSQGQGNTISVSSGLSYEKQRNSYSIQFTDYDICHRIRVNPVYFANNPDDSFTGKLRNIFKDNSDQGFMGRLKNIFSDNFHHFLKPDASAEKILHVLNRGLLICSRPKEMTPVTKTENFYIVQQKTENKEMQDSGDAKNRFLFITLRGDSDFLRFEHMTKGKVSLPEGANLNNTSSEIINRRLLQTFDFRPSSPKIFVEP